MADLAASEMSFFVLLQAANIWLQKLTARVPILANLRRKRSISDLTLPALPDNLFLQWLVFNMDQDSHE